MDTPIDKRFPEPIYWQAFLERRAAGDYDLTRVPRPESLGTLPESLGTRYDAVSDAFCAPEGMAPPLDIPVTDGGKLPAVRWRTVSGRPVRTLPQPSRTRCYRDADDPDEYPLVSFTFRNIALAALAILGLYTLLVLIGAGPGGH